MTVRPASEADLDAVLALIRANSDLPQWERSALATGGEAAGLTRFLLVAEKHGTVAGFVQIGMVLDEAEVESMAVATALRRQGIGRALLAEALQQAWTAGAAVCRLEVRSGNRDAQRLYRASGFTAAGTRQAYYSNPVEDAVLMHCWHGSVSC